MLNFIRFNLKRLILTLFIPLSYATIFNFVACQQKLNHSDPDSSYSRNNDEKAEQKEGNLDETSDEFASEQQAEEYVREVIESKTLSGMSIIVDSFDFERKTVEINLPLSPDFTIHDFRKDLEECWSDFKSIDIHKAPNYQVENIVNRKFSIVFNADDELSLKAIVTLAMQES